MLLLYFAIGQLVQAAQHFGLSLIRFVGSVAV